MPPTNTTEKKQVEALQSLESHGKESPSIKKFISKEKLNHEIMNGSENFREQEQQIDRIKMLYKGCKITNDFAKFRTVQSFGDAIRNGIITMDMANDEQKQMRRKRIREY